MRPNPIDRVNVIPAAVTRVISDRANSLACPSRIANTAPRSGRIHGAITVASMITALLSATKPRQAIRLAPTVRTMKDSFSRASPS